MRSSRDKGNRIINLIKNLIKAIQNIEKLNIYEQSYKEKVVEEVERKTKVKVDIYNTDKKYNIIYADPPWKYKDKMKMHGKHGDIRGAESFYRTMNLEDIKNLGDIIKKFSETNCILFIWFTMPFLNKIDEILESWGFSYKTCGFNWVKITKNGKIHIGMGHYTRGNGELCIIGTKGKVKIQNHTISQIMISQVRKHSQKPDEIRQKIVDLCGDLPRIELFAREEVEGWDCWGNEV